MTTENKKRFTLISNTNFEENQNVDKVTNYHTNPLNEKLVKFKAKEKFSVSDLLKW